MTNVEKLVSRFAKIPRLEETGPQKGYNGKRMARKGLRTRLIHAALCAVGILPFALYLFGADVDGKLIAAGFGLIVPGGGFMAVGEPVTVLIGLFICFYLWKKRGMMIQDFMGSFVGIAGFWLLGVLGGFLSGMVLTEYLFKAVKTPVGYNPWGYLIALGAAVILFGGYELRVQKMYQQMKDARAERTKVFDQAIAEFDRVTAAPAPEGTGELDAEQLRAARFLLEATVREEGDLSGFEFIRGLGEYRYQLSAFGYGLMVLHAKYLPNFEGYLKRAHRFLIKSYEDPRTCAYWAKEMLAGYWKRDPDPVGYANVMLSGWMMPVIAGYGDQYDDREFEKDASIRFRPIPDKPEETCDYSVKGVMEALYRQFAGKEFPYMLIPCEPHVAFPTCNSYGLLGMLLYDRDHGTHYCEDFWDELYDNVSSEFIEIDGSMALRRQDQYGLRHLPASQIGHNAFADVQNYMHFAAIFPGIARRGYALLRKTKLEIKNGVAAINDTPWVKIINMFNGKPDASLQLATLELNAAEYGDTEMYDALLRAEEQELSRSKDPRSFQFKDVNSLTACYLAFGRLLKKGYWEDVILRGMPETSKTGPLLADCAFPDVIPAKAASNGDDLDLVLYNGGEPGDQELKLSRLTPNTKYTVNGGMAFDSDAAGAAAITVNLDGRTPVYIARAV
ncbi:MAG: hypothetical protein LBT36_05320 [Oscillospiraceae bacterium]|nr:hypothetical protein [Oscillospiraceae bacterium]